MISNGEFGIKNYVDKSDDLLRFGSGIFHIEIENRPGIGIHAGRASFRSRTEGCIRTNEAALNALRLDMPSRIVIGD